MSGSSGRGLAPYQAETCWSVIHDRDESVFVACSTWARMVVVIECRILLMMSRSTPGLQPAPGAAAAERSGDRARGRCARNRRQTTRRGFGSASTSGRTPAAAR